MFSSDLNGRDHFAEPSNSEPFVVGWLDKSRDFVHVLDDESLEILLTARDTITDFLDYLVQKEELVSGFRDHGVRFDYAGEEDLLAHYLMTMKAGRHGFSFPDGYNLISIDEGDWVNFQRNPQRAAQLAADQISYAWDTLVEKFNEHILGGTSHFTTNPLIADREKLMRFFAREPRTRRRLLAESLFEILEKTGPSQRGTRVVWPSYPGDPYYCFLVLPKSREALEDEYRVVRRNLLAVLCQVTKVVSPEALDIIGLATETSDTPDHERTEDALYFDARKWTAEDEAKAQIWQKELKLLVNLQKGERTVSEYPLPDGAMVALGKNPRNKPCPCGSGKKFKKCHGA
jgi:hypothetical protein